MDPKNPDAQFLALLKQIQANTEAELNAQNALPKKFTRASGMEDPELDLSPIEYDSSTQKQGV